MAEPLHVIDSLKTVASTWVIFPQSWLSSKTRQSEDHQEAAWNVTMLYLLESRVLVLNYMQCIPSNNSHHSPITFWDQQAHEGILRSFIKVEYINIEDIANSNPYSYHMRHNQVSDAALEVGQDARVLAVAINEGGWLTQWASDISWPCLSLL